MSDDPRDRDKRLRQQIQDAPNSSEEARLERQLLRDVAEQMPEFNIVVEHEWEVTPGNSQEGKGDIVLTDGDDNYMVIEAKHIDNEATGKTARTRRNHKRKTVKQQALRYRDAFRERQPDAKSVKAATYTNESGLNIVDEE